MAKIEVNKVELVWPGKYNEDGTLKEVPRVNLPFQVIERVNESRATREATKKPQNISLFDVYEGKEGDTFEEGWKNKLIWGDNLLVMGSLLEKFAGKIDLIYIDPPFATGADFSYTAPIGESGENVFKEQSVIEEKAYRDTWGSGLMSYVQMMHDRLVLARDLLCETGEIYVHCDPRVNSHMRLVLDGIFGSEAFVNEIIWKRSSAHNMKTKGYVRGNDTILFFAKGNDYKYNQLLTPYTETQLHRYKKDETGRLYKAENLTFSTANPSRQFEWRGTQPPVNRSWGASLEKLEEWWSKGRILTKRDGTPRLDGLKIYLDETQGGNPLTTLWDDIARIGNTSSERLDYPTQKPEALLKRVMEVSSNEGDLVMDFFCGSGTTLAVAEKLGRRWIGCDLSRWAMHTTRKRLLGIEGAKPFEVLNLGKYERKYWMGATFGKKGEEQRTIYEYIAFILKLYGAQPLSGMQHLHGKKGKAMVHVGAVDAPVTIDEVNAAIEECLAVNQTELHVLGWEWEMGMSPYIVQEAKRRGIKLLLLNIPREVMEQQAVDKGDIKFFELAHLEVDIKKAEGRKVTAELTDFAFPYADLIPEEVREKITKWSDYVDYWAIDWDFQSDTFMQGWVAYRTRKERKLPLTSDPHTYEQLGTYTIMVKVIDIFGNDTSQTFEVEV